MEFDEDDESGLGFAKPSKNEQIYGIFNPFDDSDPSPPSPSSIFKPTSFHPAEPDSPKTLPKYFNFKKSDHILYEPSKTIQVKYANKNTIINGPDIDKNTIINDKTPTINNESKALIKSKRIFDFKNKRTSNIDSFDFPKALGQVHKKVKTEIMTPQTTQEAQKLKEQYGKGYLMARNLGFEVGKGLGKEKQGILKPLEAVQKTSYNSNFENRLDQGVPKNRKHDIIDDKPEENEEKGDETEKVVKRWKKNNNRLKRRLPVKELDTEKVFIGEKTMKIIDMRGPETRFLGSMTIPKDINNATTSNKAKNKGLSEFLLVLKSEYEGFKHNLHDFMRKTRFEEDKKITSTYEIGLLENKTKVLTEEKAFLLKALSILKTLEQLDLIEIIKAFDEIIALSSRFTLEFELYLYFLKAFTHKARINPQRISFRPEMKVFLGLFLRIKGNLTVLFPEQRVIDPFDPRKEELMSKRPKKLIEQVFKESIWPGIRGFLTNEFKPIEDSEEIIKFLEDWKGVLPIEVLEEVFESSIRVKLEGEIKVKTFKISLVIIYLLGIRTF